MLQVSSISCLNDGEDGDSSAPEGRLRRWALRSQTTQSIRTDSLADFTDALAAMSEAELECFSERSNSSRSLDLRSGECPTARSKLLKSGLGFPHLISPADVLANSSNIVSPLTSAVSSTVWAS